MGKAFDNRIMKMSVTQPVSIKIIVTALIFGAATLTIVEMGFLIPILGPSVHTDPREVLVTLGAALSGPIGGILIGLFSIPWFTEINTAAFSSLAAHVLGGFFMGISYKKLVYHRRELPWLLFGWAALIIAYYYLILIPVYIFFFSSLDPAAFALTFEGTSFWQSYTTMVRLAAPELIITAGLTTLILAVLPPKYRCPLWCHYDSSNIAAGNNTLAIRLTGWFLILSSLPLATAAIFVLHSVDSGFNRVMIAQQREQIQRLAAALTNGAELQQIPLFQDHDITPQNSFAVIDLSGRYLSHQNSSKIGTLIEADFDAESAKLILSGKTTAFVDGQTKHIVASAGIPGQQKIVVSSNNNALTNGIVAAIHRSARIKLTISFLIISIAGGIVIWLIVGRPVRQFTRFAEQVGKGNLDIQLDPDDAVDELQVLSSTFNNMTCQLDHLIKGLNEKVTELEKTETRLIHSENQFRSLNDNIPVGVFRSTPDGEMVSINSALLQMMALGDVKLSDTAAAKMYYQNPEDRAVLLTELQNRKQINGFQCQLKRRDGTTFLASISARTIKDDNDTIKYVDGIVEDITEREKAEQARKISETMLRALSVKLQEVEEANRKEIARELHDQVGQTLTALNINLNILHNQLQPDQSEETKARLEESIELLEETTVSIRDVMAELRPQVLDDYGLAASLRWYRERFCKRTGLQVDLDTAAIDEIRFPEKIETALFRIIQEALTNVIKHGRAARVFITAEKTAKTITLTISDDGQGFDMSGDNSMVDFQHWGLVNMRERTEALGGRFQIESDLGKGTRIRIEVPVQTR